ncbi:HAD-IA family hydrolase [Candidatus Beckwithbacteria bacterium]|nr:HAD-IA family hydrolase [Candidatus Beckwithbacteria bacterium]
MKKKLIIFDFDGTIADTLTVVKDIILDLKTEYHLEKLTEKDIEQFRNQEIWQIAQKLNIPIIKVPFFIFKIQKLLSRKIDQIKPFPHIPHLLQDLARQKYELGIISNNNQRNIKKFLQKEHIDFFHFIEESNFFLGKAKVLEKILQEKNLQKGEIIYIGDETRDIKACQSIGVQIIAVAWGYQKKAILTQHRPNYLASNAKEIKEIINQISA